MHFLISTHTYGQAALQAHGGKWKISWGYSRAILIETCCRQIRQRYVYVCMYVCMCIFLYVPAYARTFAVCMYVCIYIYIYIYIYEYVYLCTYVYITSIHTQARAALEACVQANEYFTKAEDSLLLSGLKRFGLNWEQVCMHACVCTYVCRFSCVYLCIYKRTVFSFLS
jgi:hypothetical protein